MLRDLTRQCGGAYVNFILSVFLEKLTSENSSTLLSMNFFLIFLGCLSYFATEVYNAPAISQSSNKTRAYWRNDVIENPKNRNFRTNPTHRWPKGRIPYVLSSEYSAADVRIIMNAMHQWETKTCIRFIQKQYSDTSYVEITPNDATTSYCYSHVGRSGGQQLMKMFGECMRPAAMIHELGHLIGFNHEHQRPDRDDYITVHFNNIDPAFHFAFDLFDRRDVNTLQTPYDIYSVMQYPFFAFAKTYDEERPSMTLTNGSIDSIYRETEELSQIDILKTQLYYNYCI